MSPAETPAAERKNAPFAGLLLLVVAAVAFWTMREPFLELPLTRDEGEYAYIAQRWAAGDVPYRDAFDQKPPGVFLAYRVAFNAGGESVRSVRLLHAAWVVLTALVVFFLARRAAPRAGAVGAGGAVLAFVVVVSSHGWFGHVANTEVFMLLPMTASALFLWRAAAEDRKLDWLLCGACAMLAFWFKPVAATSGLWVVLFVIGLSWRGGTPGWLLRLTWRGCWLVAGAAGVSVAIVLPFLIAGAWSEFVDAVFVHNLRYSSAVDAATGLEILKKALGKQAPELAPLWGLAALACVARWREARASLAWLVFCALGVCVGFYFRPHYFMELGPPLALLAGVGGAWLVERLARWRVPAVLGALVVAAAMVVPLRVANAELLALDVAGIVRKIYDVNPIVEAPQVAERIRAGSSEDDTVYVFGSEPQILFYAGRRSATRYIITYPLLGGFEDSAERQREAIAEVRLARPKWIVVVSIVTSHLAAPDADPYLATETSRLIADGGYVLDAIWVPVDVKSAFKMFDGARAAEVSDRQGERAAVRLYRR